MRKFKLINSTGQEFDMMRKDAFFSSPGGLGWGVDSSIESVGNSYIVTETKPEKPSPSGEMVFLGYAQYKEFLEFVQAGSLTLAYMPIATWYYLGVVISIDKEEIQSDSVRLICPISFTATSLWHENVIVKQAQTDTGSGKIYSFTYPYSYVDSVSNKVDIENGNLTSYPRITIFGPVTNPSWNLYQNNVRTASGKLTITVAQGRKIIIDSDPSSMEISEYTTDGTFVADRYSNSDFTTERIFELPAGNCSIVFAQEGTGNVRGWVEVRKRV